MLGLLSGNPAMAAAAQGMGTPPPGVLPPPPGASPMGGGAQQQSLAASQRHLDNLPPPAIPRLPNVPPEQYVDPQQRMGQARTMARQLMGPAPRMIGAPQIAVPQLSDANVQGQIPQEDPYQRAMRASGAGEVKYEEPDFLARPEGEEELEDFAWRRMVSMGNYAPPAMVQAWGNIQQAKQGRMEERAKYFSSLIQQRHRADLQLRNQSAADRAANARSALRNVAEIGMTNARLKMEARTSNQRAMNQYNMQLAGTTQNIMGATGVDPSALKETVKEVQPNIDQAVEVMQNIMDLEKLAGEAGGWGGMFGQGIDWFERNRGSQKAIQARQALKKIAMATLLKAADGKSRLFDSAADRKAFEDTMANMGSMNEATIRKNLQMAAQAAIRGIESDLRYAGLTRGAATHVARSIDAIRSDWSRSSFANSYIEQANAARAGEIAAGDVRAQ